MTSNCEFKNEGGCGWPAMCDTCIAVYKAKENVIRLDPDNTGSFFGPVASKYSYTPELRAEIDSCFRAAQRSDNRAFVLNGTTLIAAQSTEEGALRYMQAGYVLVVVEVLKPTPEQVQEAARCWRYFPYRSCWIALKKGEDMQLVLKATAHRANSLARQGWTVNQLQRGA